MLWGKDVINASMGIGICHPIIQNSDVKVRISLYLEKLTKKLVYILLFLLLVRMQLHDRGNFGQPRLRQSDGPVLRLQGARLRRPMRQMQTGLLRLESNRKGLFVVRLCRGLLLLGRVPPGHGPVQL